MNLFYPEKIHATASAGLKPAIGTIQFGDGFEQRYEIGINTTREEWNVMWPLLKKDEFVTALAVINSVTSVVPLVWQSPSSSEAKKFIIAKDSVKFQKAGTGWELGLVLTQVFDQ